MIKQIDIFMVIAESYYLENAEIASINPVIPQSWGTF